MKVLLYYKYIDVPNAKEEADAHRGLCKSLDLKGRILISNEGINGTCSGTEKNIERYIDALNTHPLFQGMDIKKSEHPDHVFKKLFVRLRPEIVSLHTDTKPDHAAPYISPKELHHALEKNEDLVLIDMRNDYEAKIGKFRNAVTLPVKSFREIPRRMDDLRQYKDKNIVTYCTGGIRCEKASAFLKDTGFSRVRQLEGGIVRYCEEFPDGYFDGGLFVFDERKCMRFSGKLKPRYISHCEYCEQETDRYVDCSLPTCHDLFVCCEECERKNSSMCMKHEVKVIS